MTESLDKLRDQIDALDQQLPQVTQLLSGVALNVKYREASCGRY